MDEPTAALSHKEIAELYELVERLKAEGKAILFISHKFDEIFRIADRYTVFRDGQMVGEGLHGRRHRGRPRPPDGRPPDRRDLPQAPAPSPAPRCCQVAGYSHPTEFDDIGFTLRRGEILGFYGLVGAGRSEFMQALFGTTRPSKGVVKIDGRIAVIRSPADAIARGIVYVPEDRGQPGRDPRPADLPERHPALARPHLAPRLPPPRRGVPPRPRVHAPASTSAPPPSTRTSASSPAATSRRSSSPSGWRRSPRVIILDEPTKGIDIGSKAAVHAFMAELAAQGLAVIMVSSEIPEILGMSDRVIVMREGRIVGEYRPRRPDPREPRPRRRRHRAEAA